jgi:hypothetical protein
MLYSQSNHLSSGTKFVRNGQYQNLDLPSLPPSSILEEQGIVICTHLFHGFEGYQERDTGRYKGEWWQGEMEGDMEGEMEEEMEGEMEEDK